MSLNRYAARSDANAPELVKLAERLGWELWPIKWPCDHIGVHQRWPNLKAIEIKSEDGELRQSQAELRKALRGVGDDLLIWRTADDVIRDSQWRKSA